MLGPPVHVAMQYHISPFPACMASTCGLFRLVFHHRLSSPDMTGMRKEEGVYLPGGFWCCLSGRSRCCGSHVRCGHGGDGSRWCERCAKCLGRCISVRGHSSNLQTQRACVSGASSESDAIAVDAVRGACGELGPSSAMAVQCVGYADDAVRVCVERYCALSEWHIYTDADLLLERLQLQCWCCPFYPGGC